MKVGVLTVVRTTCRRDIAVTADRLSGQLPVSGGGELVPMPDAVSTGRLGLRNDST